MRVRLRLAWLVPVVLAACSEKIEGPAPTVAALDPSLVCGEQIVTEVQVSGEELSPLAIEAATDDPRLAVPDITLRRVQDLSGQAVSGVPITLPNDPADPDSARVTWTSPTSMSFTVYPELGLEPGLYEITITNRNGQSATLTAAITAVPRPTIESVEPDLICVAEGGRPVTLRGSGFLDVGGTLPTVTVGTLELAVESVEDCAELPGPTAAQTCATAHITVPDSLAAGAYDVALLNPDPAGCHSTDTATLAVTPPPTLASVEPDLTCVAQAAQTFTLTGTGFVVVDGAYPTVTLDDGTNSAAVEASAADGCTPIEGTTLGAESCTELTVTLPVDALPPGVYDVTVENPPPAGCSSTDEITMAVVGPPTVTELQPPAVCLTNQPTEMTAVGTGFLVERGTPDVTPTVLLDGTEMTVLGMAGCTPVTGTSATFEACTSITFSLPTLTAGAHSLEIVNPEPADCSYSATVAFEARPAPELAGVAPYRVCTDGGRFQVTATDAAHGFSTGAVIHVRPAGTTDPWLPVATTYIDATHVEGELGVGTLATGPYDVTVENGTGCEATPLAAALSVVEAPFVFFADPPVIYDQMDIVVTIYASGVSGSINAVRVQPSTGGAAITLTITDASRPNRVQVRVPEGTLTAGDWDIIVDDDTCTGTLPAGLHVTDQLTVWVESIEVPFGWTADKTPVEIHSLDPAPTGYVSFAATPRAYLSPRTTSGVATEVRSLSFLDSTRMTGTVPAGLTVDTYDLVVINPDGAVGVLANAFTVHDTAPPVITGLLPGSVPSQDGQHVTVVGTDFVDPTAGASCLWYTWDDLSGTWVEHTASLAATVSAGGTATEIDTVWDFTTAGVPNSAVCVVRVTNSDGRYADFSALSVTPASRTPNDLKPAATLTTPRRAAAGAALRMNSLDRYVFAIGGDNGLTGGSIVRHASVEGVRVDPYGAMEAFAEQRNALPAGRTYITGATLGRFVYVPGGQLDGGVDATVLRAYLLDPDEAPEIIDVEPKLDPTSGLAAGTWSYRVAAVLDGADPNNPGGEALASEPLLVRVPEVNPAQGKKVQLTIYWSAVPHALRYRIYRTPTVDGVAGEERLLDEIDAGLATPDRYTDTGALTVDPAGPTPMPLGSLGTWHVVGSLWTARAGHAAVIVPDPNDAGLAYLYAIGGLGAGGVLRSYERATITVGGSNQQTLSGFTEVADALPDGRWQVAAAWVNHLYAPVVPATDAWIYVLPGYTAAGANVNHVTAFRVDTRDGAGADDGSLATAIEVKAPTEAMGGGYGCLGRNGWIYLLGGSGAITSASKSAEICQAAGGSCGTGLPELVMWNAGIQMTVGRMNAALAIESGFVFLLGGNSPAIDSTESTNI